MTYQQVRDVVTRIRETHQQLRDVLKESGAGGDDPRAQLMLDSLRKEEKELQLTLEHYCADGEKELFDTWLQYVPDEEVIEKLRTLQFSRDMSADEIIARKLEFDQEMLSFLRQLAAETSIPRVEEFFRTLLENAENRATRQAWSTQEYYGEPVPSDSGS